MNETLEQRVKRTLGNTCTQSDVKLVTKFCRAELKAAAKIASAHTNCASHQNCPAYIEAAVRERAK